MLQWVTDFGIAMYTIYEFRDVSYSPKNIACKSLT